MQRCDKMRPMICAVCGTEQAPDAPACVQCGASSDALTAAANPLTQPDPSSPDLARRLPVTGTIDHGAFTPGTLLGARYRIVALLGRGGMKSMFDQFSEDFAILTEGRLTQHPIEYFRRFYGDMAAFSPGAVNVARDFLGADHLLFGTDAPFDATGGRSSIRESIAALNDSACTEVERANIFTTNVERFFNLAPTS